MFMLWLLSLATVLYASPEKDPAHRLEALDGGLEDGRMEIIRRHEYFPSITDQEHTWLSSFNDPPIRSPPPDRAGEEELKIIRSYPIVAAVVRDELLAPLPSAPLPRSAPMMVRICRRKPASPLLISDDAASSSSSSSSSSAASASAASPLVNRVIVIRGEPEAASSIAPHAGQLSAYYEKTRQHRFPVVLDLPAAIALYPAVDDKAADDNNDDGDDDDMGVETDGLDSAEEHADVLVERSTFPRGADNY
jgi:hypothetical protein